MAPPRWLNEAENKAWRGWMAMSDLLRARIARDLLVESGLSDSDFAILVHLSEAPEGRVRMTELAGALGWSKSRLSHQCSRMARRGLVCREGCAGDARSAYAVLTPCGLAEIQKAAPLHVESVRRHLIDLLDASELQAMAAISERVLTHLRSEASPCGTDVEFSGALPPCPTQARAGEAAAPL